MPKKKGSVRINVNDVIGKRLGSLQVVGYAGYRHEHTRCGTKMRHYYYVHCDCGTTKIIARDQIVGNNTHSCGCSKVRKRYGN